MWLNEDLVKIKYEMQWVDKKKKKTTQEHI